MLLITLGRGLRRQGSGGVGAGVVPSNGLLTEDGQPLMTEAAAFMLYEPPPPEGLLTEDWRILLCENADILVPAAVPIPPPIPPPEDSLLTEDGYVLLCENSDILSITALTPIYEGLLTEDNRIIICESGDMLLPDILGLDEISENSLMTSAHNALLTEDKRFLISETLPNGSWLVSEDYCLLTTEAYEPLTWE